MALGWCGFAAYPSSPHAVGTLKHHIHGKWGRKVLEARKYVTVLRDTPPPRFWSNHARKINSLALRMRKITRKHLKSLYSQGRDAGVEECIDFCTKYAEDDEDKRGQLQNAVASTARRIATELLKLKRDTTKELQ